MVKLPKKTKYLRVCRFHLVATPALIAKHSRNLEVENQLHNYAVRYLKKTMVVSIWGEYCLLLRLAKRL